MAVNKNRQVTSQTTSLLMADDLNIRYPGVALKNTLGIPIREKSLTSEPYIFFRS